MSSPESRSEPEKSEGERWLELLGLGHLKGLPTGYEKDGRPLLSEEFDKICGNEARPYFEFLESMNPEDPKYKQYVDLLRKRFNQYFRLSSQ